jgi:hypothetical protein
MHAYFGCVVPAHSTRTKQKGWQRLDDRVVQCGHCDRCSVWPLSGRCPCARWSARLSKRDCVSGYLMHNLWSGATTMMRRRGRSTPTRIRQHRVSGALLEATRLRGCMETACLVQPGRLTTTPTPPPLARGVPQVGLLTATFIDGISGDGGLVV